MSGMQANGGKKTRNIHGVILAATAIALVGMVSTIGLLRGVDDLGPRVGDIMVFEPGESLASDFKARVSALTADGRPGKACVLDVRAMHSGGGSVVIEAHTSEIRASYRVHWAGPRTSEDATNCGAAADLVLNREDIAALAISAGGFGVTTPKLAVNTFWSTPDPPR